MSGIDTLRSLVGSGFTGITGGHGTASETRSPDSSTGTGASSTLDRYLIGAQRMLRATGCAVEMTSRSGGGLLDNFSFCLSQEVTSTALSSSATFRTLTAAQTRLINSGFSPVAMMECGATMSCVGEPPAECGRTMSCEDSAELSPSPDLGAAIRGLDLAGLATDPSLVRP